MQYANSSACSSDWTPSKLIFHETFVLSPISSWGIAGPWRVHRNGHGWALILFTVTQHVAACTTQARANVTHKSHNKCLSSWMCFSARFDKPGVVSAVELLQGWAGVRCRQLAVMWSVFTSCCSDKWSLSAVLKVFTLSIHKVQEQHTYSRGQL